MKWYIYVLKNTFTYQGRARRAEYGWFHLTNFLINLGLTFAVQIFIFGGALTAGAFQSDVAVLFGSGVASILGLAYFMLSIVTFFATISLTTRRLHDLGWSGWWQLMFYFGIPLASFLALILFLSTSNSDDITNIDVLALFIIFSIVSLIYLVIGCILFFKDGQRHANKYGEDPKAIPATANTSEITTQS